VAPKKKSDPFTELKTDPELRPHFVPIPDYGMISAILLLRILKRLEEIDLGTVTPKTK